MNNKVVTLVVIGNCLLQPHVAHAQTAEVKGKVVNRAGKAIEGASIKLISSVDDRIGRRPEERLSEADGSFRVAFDWTEITNGTQQGAVWEVSAEKTDYVPRRASVRLVPGRAPPEVKIELSPRVDRDRLTSKVDGCASPGSDTSTVYLFDFANDSPTPQRLITFQRLLLHKLKNGVRTKLEAAGLLMGFPFDIKLCREAPVRDESDAVFAGKRLGCPGVIYGFVEEQTNQFKSLVSFTVPSEPPLTDLAQDVSSSDLSSLIQPNQEVGAPYLAFSSFVLGTLHLHAGHTDLAMKCFRYAQSTAPGSLIAEQSAIILKQVQQDSPAAKLAPVGKPPP